MKILCSKCGHVIESVIIERELAWAELFANLNKHIMRQHPQVMNVLTQAVKKVAAMLGAYMVMSECAVIPEDQDYVNNRMEEMQDLVMMGIGFDPEIEEDAGEEGEEPLETDPSNPDVEPNEPLDNSAQPVD